MLMLLSASNAAPRIVPTSPRIVARIDITAMGRPTHAGGLTPPGAGEGSSMLGSVVTAGAAGALMGGAAGFLVGGVMNLGAEAGALLQVENLGPRTDDTCVDKNCAQIGALIGAAAGFVLGATFGAVLAKRRPTNGQANVAVVPLRDGRLGVGASVRF